MSNESELVILMSHQNLMGILEDDQAVPFNHNDINCCWGFFGVFWGFLCLEKLGKKRDFDEKMCDKSFCMILLNVWG
jgi:hypothetical protein